MDDTHDGLDMDDRDDLFQPPSRKTILLEYARKCALALVADPPPPSRVFTHRELWLMGGGEQDCDIKQRDRWDYVEYIEALKEEVERLLGRGFTSEHSVGYRLMSGDESTPREEVRRLRLADRNLARAERMASYARPETDEGRRVQLQCALRIGAQRQAITRAEREARTEERIRQATRTNVCAQLPRDEKK